MSVLSRKARSSIPAASDRVGALSLSDGTAVQEQESNSYFSINHHDLSFIYGFASYKVDYPFNRSRTPSLTFCDEDEEFERLDLNQVTETKFGFIRHDSNTTESSIESPEPFSTPSEAGYYKVDGCFASEGIHFPELEKMDTHVRLSEPQLNYEGLHDAKSNTTMHADYFEHSGNIQSNVAAAPAIDPAITASSNVNNFNLSDFLSDGDQEQHGKHLNGQEEEAGQGAAEDQVNSNNLKLTLSTNPHLLRDIERGPWSTASSPGMQPADLLDPRPRPGQNAARSLSFHSGQQPMETTHLIGDNKFSNAPQRPTETLFRHHTDLPAITCGQGQMTSQSLGSGAHMAPPPPYLEENVFAVQSLTGPPDHAPPPPLFVDSATRLNSSSSSTISSPNTSVSPLWNHNEDHRSELSNAGMGGYGAHAAYMGYSQSAPNFRFGALRSQRFQGSPYGASGIQAAPSANVVQHAAFTGQHINGIITKRSRGRRVPNNPNELNNLGKSGKVYTCKVPGCGKCFKRSEHLKRHVRSIHTDEKPFTCHCGKTFSRHDNLNQHARVHQQGFNSHLASPLATSQHGSVSPAISTLSLNSPDTRRNLSLVGSRLRCSMGDNDASRASSDNNSDIFRLDA